MRSGDAAFDPRVQLREDLSGAGVPQFQGDGFTRPATLELVRDGRYAASLVSPRSSREFSLPSNGAADSEAPEALSMAAGDLDDARALARLGEGIAISNFWYLNFSDRQACRVTGLTRFATMWVRDGEPVAPVEVMRFDDSLYRVFGSHLEALGAHAYRTPNTDTSDARSLGSTTAPGALVDGFTLTL
jgi:predicted Zn-dependent protease